MIKTQLNEQQRSFVIIIIYFLIQNRENKKNFFE